MTPDTPTGPARPQDKADDPDLETALRDAEQFLVKSGEAVHPALSPRTMMRYLNQYRTHLHAVVASTRREQGLDMGKHA
jgi:hypothetical protein